MNEPKYTYSAAAPCFKITHDRPFVLQGCSCGWPQNVCVRFQGALSERNKMFTAKIMWAEPYGDGGSAK